RLPVGVEFALHAGPDGVRLLADPPSNPFAVTLNTQIQGGAPVPPPAIANPLPGFFSGRWEQHFNRPFLSLANEDGRYNSLRVVTNRRRFGRDGTEYAGFGYDRGVLHEGPPPDGSWERAPGGGAFEVRIPWGLLNVTDPSERRVLQDSTPGTGDFGTTIVPGIHIVAATVDGAGRWTAWPASGRAEDVALFTWPGWEVPRYTARRRPAFDAMREAFRTMRPVATGGGGAP
ncbi:MAG TPA: hypothetical protein VFH27_13310, partial [Longimicrobiaceae bacterium]|nr:hypothetical protein [Longimicrobiaceae bacterium]